MIIKRDVERPVYTRAPRVNLRQTYGGEWVSDKTRMPMKDRPFCIWDGEGDDNQPQNYILLGFLIDENHYDYVAGKSLSSEACLEFIYQVCREYDQHIHATFGFSYDVDQILKDMPDLEKLILKTDNVVRWKGWRITYIQRKFFRLKPTAKGSKEITLFDAMSFFGMSMVKAAAQYVPDHPLLAEVEQGKAARGSFRYDNLGHVLGYWRAENELFLSVMCALRSSLKGAGINLDSWHGPGAVANTLIKTNRLGAHLKESRELMPLDVTEATQFSFFGGRFEDVIVGRIPGPIYAYDLRSAYPAALARMPGLRYGHWQHRYDVAPDTVNDWGLYRYKLDSGPVDTVEDVKAIFLGLGPLPNRAPNGTVSYAMCGEGWSYGHEIRAAYLSAQRGLTLKEGWEFISDKEDYPFIFTAEMYVKRAQYKAAGNPAQLGLKLGMNSVYGKLAQTVGYDEKLLQPPRYHHAWYAGQITSWCRARVALAMAQKPTAVIACETDGIYSLVPLDLRIGSHLGEWEATTYDEMIYIQSGFYFARKGECPHGCPHRPNERGSHCAWVVGKVRGLSTGQNANLDIVFASVDTLEPITTYVPRYGSFTGYIGRPQAHTWFEQERTTAWGGGGKRTHDPLACPRCQGGSEPYHRTRMTRPFCAGSSPRGLPWVENPELYCDQTVT